MGIQAKRILLVDDGHNVTKVVGALVRTASRLTDLQSCIQSAFE
jgi:hypothetical protein